MTTKRRRGNEKNPLLLLCFLAIQGCSSKSTFTSVQEDVNITIGKTDIHGTLPITGNIDRTTFGRYPMVITKEGYDPLYCNGPMVVDAGYIIADVVFRSGSFFNSYGSLPFYLVDVQEKIIKYKKAETDEWINYPIHNAEAESVKAWFLDQKVEQ